MAKTMLLMMSMAKVLKLLKYHPSWKKMERVVVVILKITMAMELQK
jgi:hypothetical protein